MSREMLDALAIEWSLHKRFEEDAVAARRAIEDQMVKLASIPETLDGTETLKLDSCEVKIVGRIDRKVDGDKLQELAAEHGLTDYLSSLFRWKPELSMTAWKHADAEITNVLSGAITAKAGRPSFKITTKE